MFHLSPINFKIENLLIILLSVIVDNVEEAELVDTLGGRDNTEPVTELLLLEELLGPISSFISRHSSINWLGKVLRN
jgi:hypothetical protein